jgi:DNA-binding transcriptional LysR family regulator/DNA-binding CsgD family transcriptional regulator
VGSIGDGAPEPVKSRGGTLRVGSLTPAAAELTGPIMERVKATFPGVRLCMVDVSSRGGESALLSGDVDVAFLWTPVSWEQLELVELFDDQVVALVGAGHRLSGHASLSVRDLAGEHYTMSTTMSDRWRQASVLRPWRSHPENAVPVPGPAGALQAIAEGHAVSIGPASLARVPSSTRLRFVSLELPGGPTSVLCRRRDDRRHLTSAFLDIANEVATAYRHSPSKAGDLRPVVEPVRRQPITQREHEVMLALVEGLTAQQIARRLSVSPLTVRKHLEHLYAKLGCHDRLTAANRARELGLLATSDLRA